MPRTQSHWEWCSVPLCVWCQICFKLCRNSFHCQKWCNRCCESLVLVAMKGTELSVQLASNFAPSAVVQLQQLLLCFGTAQPPCYCSWSMGERSKTQMVAGRSGAPTGVSKKRGAKIRRSQQWRPRSCSAILGRDKKLTTMCLRCVTRR